MAPEERFYPPILAWAGLFSCLFLAFWLQWQIWLMGLSLITLGLMWHWITQNLVNVSSETL